MDGGARDRRPALRRSSECGAALPRARRAELTGVPRLIAALQPLQIAAQFCGRLVAQVAILLERLEEIVVQLVRQIRDAGSPVTAARSCRIAADTSRKSCR